MANTTGLITVDQLSILEVDADPSTGGGTNAPIGSLAMFNSGSVGTVYVKTATALTSWELITTASLFATAVLGRANLSTVGSVPFVNTAGVLTQDAAFNWSNTEKSLTIGPTGTTLVNNPFSANGNVNGVIQANVQNLSAGALASGNIVVTADNGSDISNYLSIGINSSGNTDATFSVASALDSYVYSNGGKLVIGTDNSKDVRFFTGGTLLANERMRIDGPTGTVVVGGKIAPVDITGAGALPIFQIVGSTAVQMATIAYSNDTLPPVQNLLKSRSATVGTQGLLLQDDEVGRVQFRGSDGANFQAAASIRVAIDDVAAAGSMPGRLLMMTTPTGSTIPVERMRITQAGLIGVGNIIPTRQFDIGDTLRVRGGSPRQGMVLQTPDTTGSADWTDPYDINKAYHFVDDFISDANAGVIVGQTWTIALNLGTITSQTSGIDGDHPGTVTLNPDANNDNPTIYMSATGMIVGNGLTIFQWLVQTPQFLPNGTNNYVARVGLGDNVGGTTADFVDGVYFELPASGTTTWQCKTASNSTRTTVSSGITIVGSTWYLLEARITTTSVEYYINGSLVTTTATNIPTGAGRVFGPIARISKTAGSAIDPLFVIDAFRLSRYYSGNRY